MLGEATVQAALADLDKAVLSPQLRATLALLRKVTRQHEAVTAADMKALLALGLSRPQIEDALLVGYAFNVITRLADTFHFHVGPRAAFDVSAKMLLTRGYLL